MHAVSDNPTEPIFWLGGGPGSSNLGFKPPTRLLTQHDFVIVGYRGADGSVVLDCPEVTRAVKGVGDNLLSAESRANLGGAFAQCFTRLQEEGVDPDGYNMLEVVEDMEAARIGLGYERVNLLSESYGTRVAQIYALQHPDSLHRSVMIGVNPPGHFVWEPATIDAQLKYYARLCAQDSACGARTSDLAETMRQVTHHMPRRWLFLSMDPGKVKVITFLLLFHRNTAAMVFDTYLAAGQGDFSGLALMSLMYDLMVPSQIIWGDSAAKAVSVDYDPARDYAAEMDPPDSILSSPFSLLQWGSAPNNVWPAKPIPAEIRQAQPSDVETLLVSGSIDFATPAEFATDELLPRLTNGKQVILSEMGHAQDVWNLQPQATEHLLTSFYDSGVVDDSLYTYVPMDFNLESTRMQKPATNFSVQTIQTLDQLNQVWSFVTPILALPTGKHTLHYYAEQLAKTPTLLVVAKQDDRIRGCVLASIEDDHILVGPVAVAEDSRRRGIGSAMMQEMETRARDLGQHTLALGAAEEAEPFYLSCGFHANLFIQLPEPDSVERLEALNEGYEIVWKAEQEGQSKLMLQTPEIDKALQGKYNQAFPNCYTQYVFIKHI